MTSTPRPPKLFQGTAWYYARYRRGYPPEVIETLTKRFTLDGNTHVLDLGCGTGQLAIPLACHGIPVHAVDPDLEMLAEGIAAEKAAGARGIAWYSGSDSSIDQLYLPPLHVTTMGASFHWMARERVLAILDRLVVPSGGVVIVSGGATGGSVWSRSGSAWSRLAKQVVNDILGPERRAGGGTYQDPAERHEEILARSAFGRVDKVSISVVEEMTVDEIVGLQLSTSYASPVQLGHRVDEFCQILTERLLELEPSGIFRSDTAIELLIATR